MELIGILLVGVAIAFYIDYRSTKAENKDLREQLNKREKRKESKVAQLRRQNQTLDELYAEEQTKRLSAEYKLYTLTKNSITITPHSALDIDKLLDILHQCIPNNGGYGNRANAQGMLEWMYGKERKNWPANLQYPTIGHDITVWQGSVIYPPASLQPIIQQLETYHNTKQQGVNANGNLHN